MSTPNVSKNNLLLILDGWGYRPSSEFNAIEEANTPHFDKLIKDHPTRLITTHGLAVGLPNDQMGNSEVGHMNLGAGRVVYQTLTRIDKDIQENTFKDGEVLKTLFEKAKQGSGILHLMGLLSDGGIHSSEEHLFHVCKLADQAGLAIRFHALTDGRDTPPEVAERYVDKLESLFQTFKDARIVSVVGRYYGMDRDKRWERVEPAYQAMVKGESSHRYASAKAAIEAARARKEGDEFILPSVIEHQGEAKGIEPGDALLLMNFRADRMRQMAHALCNPETFEGFEVKSLGLSAMATLVPYSSEVTAPALYPPLPLNNTLTTYLSGLGKPQLHIAETEKYAHVTFFFAGGEEKPAPLEDRVLIPSPKVATYDLKPEMSAFEVLEKLEEALKNRTYDFIVCNLANPDMVGHTGNYEAAKKAAETVDQCLGSLVKAMDAHGGQMLVTADHGNLEQMWNEEAQAPMTQHTLSQVYLSYYGPQALSFNDKPGALANVAPTMLDLMKLPIPSEMTADSLIQSN